jgi:hypothetical protein
MPVDRGRRDELACCILQWMEKKAPARLVHEYLEGFIDRPMSKEADRDIILHDAAFWWLIRGKLRDGENVLLTTDSWEDLCDLVTALKSDLEGVEVKAPEKPSLLQYATLAVWSAAVLAATILLTAWGSPWGILLWVMGPIPYLLWWWMGRPTKIRTKWPSCVKANDREAFCALRNKATFPAYDPERFKPTKEWRRRRRWKIAVTAPLVGILVVPVVMLWPIQISANLHRKPKQES